jgi:hypothetical protein
LKKSEQLNKTQDSLPVEFLFNMCEPVRLQGERFVAATEEDFLPEKQATLASGTTRKCPRSLQISKEHS